MQHRSSAACQSRQPSVSLQRRLTFCTFSLQERILHRISERTHHLYPAVVADSINEKLFEEIGDSAVMEEDGTLSLIEDYLDDLRFLLPQ